MKIVHGIFQRPILPVLRKEQDTGSKNKSTGIKKKNTAYMPSSVKKPVPLSDNADCCYRKWMVKKNLRLATIFYVSIGVGDMPRRQLRPL